MSTPSSLHLTITAGPKQGETLQRKPGTLIRIGRVIKGNTFSIKDPSISQKHLLIQFNSHSLQWELTDLDTSNGTFLNDARIPSSTPSPLSHLDTIKIGETTSILITIISEGDNEENALRRGRSRAKKNDESLNSSVNDRRLRSGRSLVEEVAVKNVGRGRPKRTAASLVVEDGVEEAPSKNVRRRGGLRSTNNSKKGDSIDECVEVTKNLGRGRPRKAPSQTRVSNEEQHVEVGGDVADMEKNNDEVLASVEVVDVERVVVENDAGDEGELDDDIEKMTLGQWFDQMEKFLPRAINDFSEEIIASLREKAQRFDEFVGNAENICK